MRFVACSSGTSSPPTAGSLCGVVASIAATGSLRRGRRLRARAPRGGREPQPETCRSLRPGSRCSPLRPRRLRSEVRAPARRSRRCRSSTRIRSWSGIRSSSRRSLRRTRRIRRVSASERSSTPPSSMPSTGSSDATRHFSSRMWMAMERASCRRERHAGQRSSLRRIRRLSVCFLLGRQRWVTATRLRSRRSATMAETAGNHGSAASPGAHRSPRPYSPLARQTGSARATRHSQEGQRSVSGGRYRPPRR